MQMLLPRDLYKTVENSPVPGCVWNVDTCQIFLKLLFVLFTYLLSCTCFTQLLPNVLLNDLLSINHVF